MASSVTVQSVLEKISVDHLECSICTNRFRQPKLLDCLHSFCLQCLHDVRQSQDPSGTKLTCPLCRRETMLKVSGVADLPNNFAFSALVEEVTMQEKLLEGQGSDIKCQNCDEENQAISRCADCDHFLCQECQKAHGRMTVMKSHKMYTLAELRSGEIVYKSKLRDEVPKCGKHPDQNLNVYCNTCEQVICLMCTVLDHEKPKHSFIGLPEAFEKCKKKIEELVAKVGKSKTELSTTIEETCISRKKLDIMFANTKKKISEKADQEVAKIRQEEQKLLKETDRIYQERVATFEAAQATNRKEVTQTEHKLEEVKQLMNNLIAVGYEGKKEISLHNPDGSLIRRLSAPMIGYYLTMYNHRLIYTTGMTKRLVCEDYYGASVFSVDMTSNKQGGWCPTVVCCDSDGSIYVAVYGHPPSNILHYSPDGKYIGCAIKGSGPLRGITFTPNGDLVVAVGHSVKVYHLV
ncbi:E3 ubiquitin-protein ligase TRIM56-like [Patiria miniata]|uniref:Uncharacterized protein n=1 Tax=Patiria miniata TaxID=46514 RepID=A0A913ZT85_PATMI|nr:E3 ubiquitin-protein ligase TRIM56-like [Patiria miniata]